MGWLVSSLLALFIVSVLALVMPTLFGPAVAGLAPLLVVVAIIGLGGVWWRISRSRVDPERADRPGDPRDGEPLGAEDDTVET